MRITARREGRAEAVILGRPSCRTEAKRYAVKGRISGQPKVASMHDYVGGLGGQSPKGRTTDGAAIGGQPHAREIRTTTIKRISAAPGRLRRVCLRRGQIRRISGREGPGLALIISRRTPPARPTLCLPRVCQAIINSGLSAGLRRGGTTIIKRPILRRCLLAAKITTSATPTEGLASGRLGRRRLFAREVITAHSALRVISGATAYS